jgi:hypothetical protein
MVTAELAVNKELIQLSSPWCEMGSFNNRVPIIIKLKKPKASRLGGLKLMVLFFGVCHSLTFFMI